MPNIVNFIKKAFRELIHRVTWPNRQEQERLVAIFFFGACICLGLLFGMDRVLDKMRYYVYRFFGAAK